MYRRLNTKIRDNKITCLEDEVDKIYDSLGLKDKENEFKIFETWKECVGETISQYAKPIGIKKNMLMVSVESSVWRFELANRKEEILKNINKNLQSIKHRKLIKDIVFV